MQSRLNPYLGFKDNARQAMEFYSNVFGGKLVMNTFGEAHASVDGTENDKIMHAMLEADNGMVLMASDTPHHMGEVPASSSISVSLSGDNEQELRGYWDKLCQDGQIFVPLEKAPWGDMFGMVTDKFGTKWLVNISAAK